MMKKIKKLNAFLFSLLITSFLTSCVSDDTIVNEPTPISELTITQVVASSSNLNIFLDALQRTNLDGTFNSAGTYTIFIPNNDAFNAFFTNVGAAGLSSFSDDQVADIVLNHVLETEVVSTDLSTGYINTISVGPESNQISLYINTANGIKMNSEASLVDDNFNVETVNGIIHLVDEVLYVPSAYDHIDINPDFSMFMDALSRTSFSVNFSTILKGETDSPFTVFAPTNTAFEVLLTDLGVDSVSEIDDATLESILEHHITNGSNIVSSSFTDAQIIPTLSGINLEIDFNDGIKVIDGTGTASTILLDDIQSGNGVIHSINRVLLPSAL